MAPFQTVIAFQVWKMGEVKRMGQVRMDVHTSTDGEGRSANATSVLAKKRKHRQLWDEREKRRVKDNGTRHVC